MSQLEEGHVLSHVRHKPSFGYLPDHKNALRGLVATSNNAILVESKRLHLFLLIFIQDAFIARIDVGVLQMQQHPLLLV